MQRSFKITDPTGIHARPATVLVNTAGKFKSDVEVQFNGKTVNLKSIMGVMSLAIPGGAQIIISAQGDDAEEALNGIGETLVREGLGEIA